MHGNDSALEEYSGARLSKTVENKIRLHKLGRVNFLDKSGGWAYFFNFLRSLNRRYTFD